jgi:hypothetical protein
MVKEPRSMTRSELVYFAAGVAVGGAVGANWSKIKPVLEALLGPAAEGFQDAYGDMLGAMSEQVESFQDSVAERKSKRSRKRAHRPRAGLEAMFN